LWAALPYLNQSYHITFFFQAPKKGDDGGVALEKIK